MRLADLLRDQREAILQEFEDFARSHTVPGTSMDIEALRDHAAGMLEAMALDLEQPQTEAEQRRKGRGDAHIHASEPRTHAEHHGLDRAQSGFSMEETFAEYRALRASVMRFYVAARTHDDDSDVQDVIRFNEAIDQALAESIMEYARAVNRYRDMFLAVLGHDLRSPLNAVLNASSFLAESPTASDLERRLASTITGSARAMSDLVDDMLEYTAEELGQGITLRRSTVDLREIAAEVVREAELVRPARAFQLELDGEVIGEWDAGRVRQALSNLVTNAVRHAPDGSAVRVAVASDGDGHASATVHNSGPPIPEDEVGRIFQPFMRADPKGEAGSGGRMGLGLYIARCMAEAHGGSLTLESSASAGTTFLLRLPRRPPN